MSTNYQPGPWLPAKPILTWECVRAGAHRGLINFGRNDKARVRFRVKHHKLKDGCWWRLYDRKKLAGVYLSLKDAKSHATHLVFSHYEERAREIRLRHKLGEEEALYIAELATRLEQVEKRLQKLEDA